MVNKLKKFGICYLLFFIVITNFSVVFADDELIDESLELQQNENDVVTNDESNFNDVVNDESIDVNNYDDEILDLQNQINSMNNNFSNSLMSLSNSIEPTESVGNNGLAVNFDFRYQRVLDKYKQLVDDYDVIYVTYDSTYGNMYMRFGKYDDNSVITYNAENNSYSYNMAAIQWGSESGGWASSMSGNSTRINSTCYINKIYNGTRGWTAWYKICDENGNNIYTLYPYSLTIENSTNVTISTKTLSRQIYYSNQFLTVTYANENDDFYCWIDSDSMQVVSHSPSYSFNINHNTKLRWLNYNEFQDIFGNESDVLYLNSSLYIIIVLVLFLLFKSLIWGV